MGNIREEILKKVSEFYKKEYEKKIFIPGKTPIPYAGRVFDEKEIISLVDSSLDFWLTAGRFAHRFEEEFANFLGVKYCILTNSGSSANLIAVSALTSPKLKDRRLKIGDEIITVAASFPTTINPILQNNFVPVFLDIELGSYNIKVDKIESAISRKTKAIFIAHTLGNPANLDRIMEIVEKYNLWFIEDNCDALGSKYDGKYTGSFGHMSTFSFYPAHQITMGEGGAVVTNDEKLKRIIISFRDWGRDCWCETGKDNTCGKRFLWKFGKLPYGYDHKYVYSHIGYNLKITDMQASIGVEQLKKLPFFIEKRKENFKFLYDALKRYDEYFILPEWLPSAQPSWFAFPLTVKRNKKFNRNDIVKFLEKNNISTRLLFAGNIIYQPAYERTKYRVVGGLKNTDYAMKNTFFIGVYPELGKAELKYILEKIGEFISG